MYGKEQDDPSPKETEGIVMYTATLGEWRKRNGNFKNSPIMKKLGFNRYHPLWCTGADVHTVQYRRASL